MNELNEKEASQMTPPDREDGADHGNDEAIYHILLSISNRWGYPSDREAPPSSPKETEKVTQLPEKEIPSPSLKKPEKVTKPEDSDWGDLEKTVILSRADTKPSPPEALRYEQSKPEPEPEPQVSEWDALEKTVIISATPSAVSKKEETRFQESEKKREVPGQESVIDTSWNDASETIHIVTDDLPAVAPLEETLIIGNRSGKEIHKPVVEEHKPVSEPLLDFDDDVILETVTIGPDSYEH